MKRTLSIFLLCFCLLLISACSSRLDINLSEVMDELEKQESLSDMMELDSSDLTDLYGISPEDVEQFEGKILSDGIHPDEIVFIKAKNFQAAARIQDALTNRWESKGNEAKDYNPDGYALIQKCGVRMDGNYVAMIVSPDYEALNSTYDRFIK